MNYKNTLKKTALAAGLVGAISTNPVYATQNNGFNSYGTDGNSNVIVDCKPQYKNISDRWIPKGELFDIRNLGNGKNVEECVENNHKSTYGDRVLEDIEGDSFADGQYKISTYKYGTNEKTGEFCVNARNNQLAFCDPTSENRLNRQFRDTKRDKVWYGFDRIGNIVTGSTGGSSTVGREIKREESGDDNTELNNMYILTPNGGGRDFSTYPSLYQPNGETFMVSDGQGFNGREYVFSNPSRFPQNKEQMAASVFNRASSVLPEQNIVAVTDAAYLRKVMNSKGNLEALVDGSGYFDENVKLRCQDNQSNCISLEDFANGVALSAVHDRVGSDIANHYIATVGNDSSRSGYAATLRDGKILNIALPGDDWILQQRTAYTGRVLNGELSDNLEDVAQNCVGSVDSSKTFSNFNSVNTINCIYSGINSAINGGRK